MRLAVILTLALSGVAGAESLGKLDFPVTGGAVARGHFERGVLALHSFFYDEALDEFRAATRAEPAFAMGHWGEAMALNHTIWENQDTAGGRAALARLGATSRLSARERAWIDAARILYGPGDDKLARDRAYAAALEKMAHDDPADLEVASFHALSLIGALDPRAPGVAQRMRAGAIALEVLAKNPRHPGAAHYVIHAFDDADHAVIALPAARRYAQIAPAAHHARHMPAHIFVNLGMWDEAAAACESAWKASEAWVARRGHPLTRRDYHSLEWLVFIYQQQGRLQKAEETLAVFADAARRTEDAGVSAAYASVAGIFLVNQGRSADLEGLLAKIKASSASGDAEPGCHSAGGGDDQGRLMMIRLPISIARQRALAAATRGDEAETRKQLELAAAQRKLLAGTVGADSAAALNEISERRIDARLLAAGKRWKEAEAKLREAIALELRTPFRGSAEPAGLAIETQLGDLLLATGQPREAAAAYAEALRLTPGDARALLGAARAAGASGDAAGARTAYRKLAAQWRNADPGAPALDEVRTGAK